MFSSLYGPAIVAIPVLMPPTLPNLYFSMGGKILPVAWVDLLHLPLTKKGRTQTLRIT